MRIVEIKISIFDRKEYELPGEVESFPSRCAIDLDRVSSFWSNGEGEICIHIGDESYWTRSYTFDDFMRLWKGQVVCGREVHYSRIGRN